MKPERIEELAYDCLLKMDYPFASTEHVAIAIRTAVREALDEAAAPQWISVAERLPEDNADVLVFGLADKDMINADHAFGVGCHLGKMGWQLSNVSGEQVEWLIAEVTHWMPLPPAPEPPR